MKIYLDDVRPVPDGYVLCQSVNQAKQAIIDAEARGEVVEVIDCDHDLGDFAYDGGDGICLLDWLVERQTFYSIRLHTMNPVGRDNMMRLIQRYWKN